MLLATKTKSLTLIGLRPTGDLGPLTGYTSKHGKPVWYLKSPPKEPPTDVQRHCRNAFRLAAIAWTQLTPERRQTWTKTQDAAHLNITGYNLFIFWQLTHDRKTIETIERQTNLTLLD